MINAAQLRHHLRVALASAGAVYIVFTLTGQVETMPTSLPLFIAATVFITNIVFDVITSPNHKKPSE